MSQELIKELIIQEGLTITNVIDAVIDLNGIVGVGLITLQDQVDTYIKEKRETGSRVSAEAWMNS